MYVEDRGRIWSDNRSMSSIANLSIHRGWEISVTTGNGPLGRETATASAQKGHTSILAMAADPETAEEMIHRMIDQREKHGGAASPR